MSKRMKLFAFVVVLALGGMHRSQAEEANGTPVLPAAALGAVAHPRLGHELTELALGRVAGIGWDSEIGAELMSEAAKPSILSASLLQEPQLLALHPDGPPPPDCQVVRHTLWQVHSWIRRVEDLRLSIEYKLRRAERNCNRDQDCDWSPIDEELAELNILLGKLLAYSEAERNSQPDRLVEYRFHLDSEEGRDWRAQGWAAIGHADLSRLRFAKGNWIPLPANSFGAEMGFLALPEAAAGSQWIVRREMRSAQACSSLPIFRMEFWATFQKAPGGPAQESRVLIDAISL